MGKKGLRLKNPSLEVPPGPNFRNIPLGMKA